MADFSRVLAGPYATMLLADLGAEVIKVERPGRGDDTRHWRPPADTAGRATYFASVNRNKTSVALDLRDPRALELALSADVMVENFAPGTLARYGLDYPSLAARKPDLVYCSITGFGAGSDLPGYDLLVQAVGGLMSITGPEGGPPTKVGVALVDVITGLHATVGVLAALRHRERTGEGQLVEVNLLSSLLSALVNQTQAVVGAAVVPRAMGNAHPSIAPYTSLRTADRDIVVAVGNDTQFTALCEVLGLRPPAQFATNPDRVAHRDELERWLERALRTRAASHWLPLLAAAGVPAGPINDIAEALALAADLGLRPVVEVDGQPGVADPITLSATPATYRLPPPEAPG